MDKSAIVYKAYYL